MDWLSKLPFSSWMRAPHQGRPSPRRRHSFRPICWLSHPHHRHDRPDGPICHRNLAIIPRLDDHLPMGPSPFPPFLAVPLLRISYRSSHLYRYLHHSFVISHRNSMAEVPRHRRTEASISPLFNFSCSSWYHARVGSAWISQMGRWYRLCFYRPCHSLVLQECQGASLAGSMARHSHCHYRTMRCCNRSLHVAGSVTRHPEGSGSQGKGGQVNDEQHTQAFACNQP